MKKIKHLKKGANLTPSLLNEPLANLSKVAADELLNECRGLAQRGWGEFDRGYLKQNVLNCRYLCLLRDEEGLLVGMTPLKRYKIRGRHIYAIGLAVVDPDYRGSSLLTKMSIKLMKRAFLESIMRGKFSIELIFITPNIRTMGTITKIAKFIYPNPYEFDEKSKSIPDPDEETEATVKEYLKVTNEKYRKFIKNGSIIEGFYDDKDHLIVKETSHSNKKLNDFAQTYIYSVPGREIVVRAIIPFVRALRYGF